MTRPPQWFTVPAGTKAHPCSSCGATIYWIFTPSGARMPVDTDARRVYQRTAAEGTKEPTAEHGGRGIAHWATCPSAAQHRKRA